MRPVKIGQLHGEQAHRICSMHQYPFTGLQARAIQESVPGCQSPDWDRSGFNMRKM